MTRPTLCRDGAVDLGGRAQGLPGPRGGQAGWQRQREAEAERRPGRMDGWMHHGRHCAALHAASHTSDTRCNTLRSILGCLQPLLPMGGLIDSGRPLMDGWIQIPISIMTRPCPGLPCPARACARRRGPRASERATANRGFVPERPWAWGVGFGVGVGGPLPTDLPLPLAAPD